MQAVNQTVPISKKSVWAGRIISSLVVVFLVFDGVTKVMKVAPVMEASARLGFPANLIAGIGAVLLACTVVYVIPSTSILGAILLTGYLGGAVVTQFRAGSPLFSEALFPVYFGIFVWGGLYLRDDRLRALIPLRSPKSPWQFRNREGNVGVKKWEGLMQKITPCLWFDGKAEEAANFYVSIFKNSKVMSVTRYGDAGPGPKGTVMIAAFQLEGQEFLALNGGPQFTFTPAISFCVDCKTQQEVDELWEKLSEGGEKNRCGWLRDKYGLSWQIVPSTLRGLVGDKDPEKSQRVMKAMLQMDKIDIKGLRQAYDQG